MVLNKEFNAQQYYARLQLEFLQCFGAAFEPPITNVTLQRSLEAVALKLKVRLRTLTTPIVDNNTGNPEPGSRT